MNYRYTLVNVAETRIDELKASFRQKAFWWTLERIWWLDSEEKIREFLARVKEYYENSPDEYVGNMLVYIARVHEFGIERLEKIVTQTISESKAGTVMATIQQLEENARIEAKLETAKNLLQKNVSLEIVLESTGLTPDQLREAGIVK
jgi:predicted transposase/invertase (TIGR01784 family)